MKTKKLKWKPGEFLVASQDGKQRTESGQVSDNGVWAVDGNDEDGWGAVHRPTGRGCMDPAIFKMDERGIKEFVEQLNDLGDWNTNDPSLELLDSAEQILFPLIREGAKHATFPPDKERIVQVIGEGLREAARASRRRHSDVARLYESTSKYIGGMSQADFIHVMAVLEYRGYLKLQPNGDVEVIPEPAEKRFTGIPKIATAPGGRA